MPVLLLSIKHRILFWQKMKTTAPCTNCHHLSEKNEKTAFMGKKSIFSSSFSRSKFKRTTTVGKIGLLLFYPTIWNPAPSSDHAYYELPSSRLIFWVDVLIRNRPIFLFSIRFLLKQAFNVYFFSIKCKFPELKNDAKSK